MFGTRHYVPILRWKQAEKLALHRLLAGDKEKMTPLIEIIPVPFLPKTSDEGTTEDASTSKPLLQVDLTPDPGSVLRRQARDVLRFWGNSSFFLDLGHLEGTVPLVDGSTHALAYFADLARSYRMKPVPVTTLNRPANYRAAAASILKLDRNGLCIRVNISELTDEMFARRLAEAIDELGASLAESDLVLDYGVFDVKAPGIADLLSKVPELQKWRSVIVARGAFPKDLQGLKPGTHRIARSDWTDWVNGLRGSAHSRWPSYSDYTIQYGQYIEPCKGANPSASIRYTLAEQWLIMRGEGIRNEGSPGAAQWNANAILLAENADFYGSGFSAGDAYISEMSREQKNHGSAGTWIQAGLNHHMSVVSRQIAAL